MTTAGTDGLSSNAEILNLVLNVALIGGSQRGSPGAQVDLNTFLTSAISLVFQTEINI